MVTRIFLCNEQTEPEIRDFIREAIADSWLRHPSAEELSAWNANKEKEFISLVVPPFVLIRVE